MSQTGQSGLSWDGRIRADARAIPLADSCVQCVVTSPPYWGLRDYGNADQIGIEPTPFAYVESLRVVFRELWRVLRADGVCWLNLGDSYARMQEGNVPQSKNRAVQPPVMAGRIKNAGLKPKDLVGIPWRVAFALQADGWYLRSDIIWAKPNPMPESVTDRCTKAHEYIFLLTKSERYYIDMAAIAEPFADERMGNPGGGGHYAKEVFGDQRQQGLQKGEWNLDGEHTGRNKRSVWTIPTRSYPEAHYATFPEEIPETCIRAGSRLGDLVLDPFFGSGTVGRVAERLSRRWVGLDLGYQDLQEKRLRNVQRELIGVTA